MDFNSPKIWCSSSFGIILAVQNTFPNILLVFGWGYTFLGKDWCTVYQALPSSLKCYAWSANLRVLLKYTYSYISPIFIHFWTNKQKRLIPNLWYILIQRLHINHQKCWLGILHQEWGVTQNDFKSLIFLVKFEFCFSF